MTGPAGNSRAVRFGVFEVDLRAGELRKRGVRIRLQDQPFEILAMLLEHPGEVVTREELRQKLWPGDTFVDFDHGLNNAMNRLREAMGDTAENPRYIETLPRRGYRFIAAVDNGPPLIQEAVSEPAPPGAVTKGAAIPRKLTDGSESLDGIGLPDGPPLASAFVASSSREHPQLPSKTPGKNRPLRMRIRLALAAILIALMFGGIVLVRRKPIPRDTAPPINSIAVLPLENLTGDPSQEYFSDGMTDALITELAQVRGLKVISRTSVMHYKGARKRLPEIARELGVDAVVEGTVERSGNEVKITAQLIRAATDTHVWAASYARVQQDVLDLQCEIAKEITKQVSNQLIFVEHTGPSKQSKVDPEAYEAYLRGTYFLGKLTPDALRAGLRSYQAAIGKDPNYAAAYAKLAQCYMTLSALGEIPAPEAYARAREAAEKAVELDENLAEAHEALAGIAQGYDWDWSKAEREYRRVIDLNPNYADAYFGYSSLLFISGRRKESAEKLRKARELDPVSLTMYSTVVYLLYLSKEYDQALIAARKGLELYPDAPLLHSSMSGIYAQTEQPRLAAEEALKAEENWGASQERMAALRHAYKTGGAKGLWRSRIDLNTKLADERHLNAYDIAYDYALLGGKNRALYWLERVYQVHDVRFPYIKLDPGFDSLRTDARFRSLVGRMGHP